MKGYPFHDGPLFARNQWYLAAWTTEIGHTPVARRILNQDVILFRTTEDKVAALSGVCPHRWMPLARAEITQDLISCPYHGARFDHQGTCVAVPRQDRVPPGFGLRRYPVVVVGPCVWIWPGEADRADPSLLPDSMSLGLGRAGWRTDLSHPFRLGARAQLLIENLFDEEHINVVHPATLGGCQADVFRDAEITDTPDRFAMTHRTAPTPVDAAMRALFAGLGSHACSDLTIELLGVSLVNNIGSRTYSADASGAPQRLMGQMNFIHAITPETDTTTHYFLAQTRDFNVEDADLSTLFSERNAKIVAEDAAILEALEPMIDDWGDARQETSFATDAIAMRLRHRIRRIIAGDRAEVASDHTALGG